ncbi:MAG: hypothetical protein Q4A54_06755, partial [Parabacteroides sp.]|nr:hypothetical protein [Parabacteroides sp.]
MKTKQILLTSLATIMLSLCMVCCSPTTTQEVVSRAEALDDSAWEASKWISAVDAQVIEKRINERAADG